MANSRTWVNLDKAPQYFTVNFGNQINENLQFIAEELNTSGYTVSIPEITFNYDTPITAIKGLFNSVESNITAIHNVVNWIDEHYEVFEWVKKTIGKRSEVQRWLDWLNGIKSILDGANRWLYLVDENGNYITDEKGYFVIVYSQQSKLLPSETLYPSDKTFPQFAI